jgi:hypothetical protein
MQFAAYAEAFARTVAHLQGQGAHKAAQPRRTAIGTGFNAPQKYIFLIIEKLKELTGLNITRAENMVDATQNLDAIVEVSGLVRTCCVNLMKISRTCGCSLPAVRGSARWCCPHCRRDRPSCRAGEPVLCEFASQTHSWSWVSMRSSPRRRLGKPRAEPVPSAGQLPVFKSMSLLH